MNQYGRIKEKKLTSNDMILTCQGLKKDVQEEINVENKRINVDSAKKRAVLQHMDYEGFRQMVLGANLYQIKSKDLQDFSFGLDQKRSQIVNPIATNGQFLKQESQEFKSQLMKKIQENQCNNFNQFRQKFNDLYHEPLDIDICSKIDIFIKSQNEQNISRIFSIGFDLAYFFKILQVYSFQMSFIQDENEFKFQLCFLVQLLKNLSLLKEFRIQIQSFLKKSERLILNEFLILLEKKSLSKIENIEQDQTTLNEDYFSLLKDIKSIYFK